MTKEHRTVHTRVAPCSGRNASIPLQFDQPQNIDDLKTPDDRNINTEFVIRVWHPECTMGFLKDDDRLATIDSLD